MSRVDQLHEAACEAGKDSYTDPATGYQVMTRLFLLRQGKCCGNACRHCPYGHMNVKPSHVDDD